MAADPNDVVAHPNTSGSVSVLIPTFRHARYISQTLDSIFTQTRHPIETIVINDGSPDDTSQVIRPYLHRITYIEQENHGLVCTLNKGLRLCSGDYLLMIGSDDWLTPDAIDAMAQVLDANPKVGLVHGLVTPVDQYAAPLEDFKVASAPSGEHRDVARLLRGNFISAPGTLCRKVAISNLQFGNYPYCQDWRMWLDLALEGWSFYGLDQQVAYYRRHEGNATHNVNAARAMRDERRMLTEFRLDYAAQLSNSHLAALDASLNRLTRSLGWTAMTSGDRATARREFFAALRLRLTWNGAMGFVAASAPKVFYDRLKQHGMNAHARTGEEA